MSVSTSKQGITNMTKSEKTTAQPGKKKSEPKKTRKESWKARMERARLAEERFPSLPVMETVSIAMTKIVLCDLCVEIVKDGWTEESLTDALAVGDVKIMGDAIVPEGDFDLENAIGRITREEEIDAAQWES